MKYAERLKTKFGHAYYRLRSYLGRPKMVVQDKPVIVSEIDICEQPIFLIGVHRSGTSLCRRLLNSHSHVACPPETFFLEHFANMIRDEKTFAGLEGMGFDRSSALQEIRVWASRYHEAYRISKNKPRWADKTPQYIEILPELEQIFGQQAQYIMIYRHPLDVVHSIFNRHWSFGNYDSDPLKNTAYYVNQSLKTQISFAQSVPERCFSLFYEKLVESPETTLKEVFEFLGLPWEEDVLMYHKFEHGFGTEDPVVRGTKGFLQNFGNWRSFSEDQISEIVPILKSVIAHLGYEID